MTKEEKNYNAFVKALVKLELKHGLLITSNGKIEASNMDSVYDLEHDLRKLEDAELADGWK